MNDGGAFVFRPLARTDLPLLFDWLSRPHVAEWWGAPSTRAEIEADYGPVIAGRDPTQCRIVEREGRSIGFIQAYVVAGSGGGWWPNENDPGARGIDQFLADAGSLNRGLGRRMVRAFVDTLFADPAVTVVQADPSPDNARAIRCYGAAGFESAGVVDTPDGPALLMRRHR